MTTSAQRQRDLMYRLLVESVTDCAIYMLGPDGRVMNWNVGAERAKGYRAEEIVGQHYARFYTEPDRLAGIPERNLCLTLEAGRFQDEGWRVRKDGTAFWAEVVLQSVHDANGQHVGFAKITRDCTERRHATALAAVKDRLDLAVVNLAQGLCLLDANQRVLLTNERLRELLDLQAKDVAEGADFQALVRAAHPSLDIGRCLDLAGRSVVPACLDADLGGRTLSVVMRGIEAGGWVVTFEDVTERRYTEAAVRFMAANDALTRLPNRDSFNRHLEKVLSVLPIAERCALLHLDLDRFKAVNDVYGHATGDALLREVAARIGGALESGEAAFRIGVDEFAVVMPMRDGIEPALERAAQLSEAIGRPFVFGVEIGRIGASIGIAIAPDMGVTASDIARKAGMALYQAKRDGRGCSRLYGDSLGRSAWRRRSVEVQLSRALEEREFELHYQAIVGGLTGALAGFEVLLRWSPPNGATMRPDEFIPIAEDMGIMPVLGGWILETACREASTWPRPLTVSVNVSPTQLREANFVEQVRAVLGATGLDAHRLELEITETAMIEDRARTLATLQRLREMGVLIALDDFGTGYSSLSFLQDFPLTRIKIDRSFVSALETSRKAAAIVRDVAGLARNLGLSVTAEGVETQAQLKRLVEEGCSEIQGYFIGRPEPREIMAARLGRAPRGAKEPAARPALALAL